MATRIGSFEETVTGSDVMQSAIGVDIGRPGASTRRTRSRSVRMPTSRPSSQTSRQPTLWRRMQSTAADTGWPDLIWCGGDGCSRDTLSIFRLRSNSIGWSEWLLEKLFEQPYLFFFAAHSQRAAACRLASGDYLIPKRIFRIATTAARPVPD